MHSKDSDQPGNPSRVIVVHRKEALRLYVHSSFTIIVKRERKLVVLLLSSYRCLVTVNVLWLFLTVPWVGLQCDCGIS